MLSRLTCRITVEYKKINDNRLRGLEHIIGIDNTDVIRSRY